jgi:hypothetical protein
VTSENSRGGGSCFRGRRFQGGCQALADCKGRYSVGSGAGIGGDSGISLVQDVEGGSLGDSVNRAMKGGTRELGLPIGSVLVK